MPRPAFVVNPLSLCITQSNFEAWLKDKGLLEMLERCRLDNAILAGQGSFAALSRLLRSNPLEGLTVQDLRKKPVAWTGEFFDCGLGPGETYSWPISVTQAKFRMEENLKRYTGNYLVLILVCFLCSLYQMPLALLGVVCLFALWDGLRIFKNHFKLDRESLRFRLLLMLGNLATFFIVTYCKVAVAFFWAGFTSFIVIIMHSSLRKITEKKGDKKGKKL